MNASVPAVVDSKFFPGTRVQQVWSANSLGLAKECWRKYYYHVVEGWRSKAESIHLTFGGLYHAALDVYYRSRFEGADHEEATIVAVSRTLIDSFGMKSDDTNKTRETLIRTVIWYLEDFKEDSAKTIILDGKPAVELTFQLDLGYGDYALTGRIDRLVEFSGQLYVMDTKTTKQTLSPWFYQTYSPDNQMTLYTIAAQIVYNTPARGVIINAAQIAVGFSRFDRGIIYRRPSELEEWLLDLHWYLDTAKRNAETDHWPMNDRACRICGFRNVCSKEVSFRPVQLASDFVKTA